MFREEKATALAALLLERAGGELDDLKLMKLMYLADREALRRWGATITGDAYFSMKNGPVLSATLNLMTPRDQDDAATVWREHIHLPERHAIRLAKPMDASRVLSQAEIEIVDAVQVHYGAWDKWHLVEYAYGLREYTPTAHTSIPIPVAAILEGLGLDADTVASRSGNIAYHCAVDQLFSEIAM